ncbi:hypothetical protein NDK43_20320 [Neobacillus pocheonensis]|uniref:Uncharacterized protein n=1 Tax=Neobacillus pocheonensis TaxID=363869 RepID=A0ABT0WFH5_9BACI|nr:hypothetical protein [Neobacillus pocheonensis]
MNLEDYLKLNHPNIIEEYNRFLRQFLPSVGSEVVTLGEDLSGISGQKLEVTGYSALGCGMDVFINLKTQTNGEHCLCPFRNWHKKIKLIKGKFIAIDSVKFYDSMEN